MRREAKAIATLSLCRPNDVNRFGWIGKNRVVNSVKILRKRNNHLIQNWYEGGFPLLSGDRSWLNQVVQDSRFDKNFVTRRELMRNMRNHAQDVPIHKRGLDVSRQYVIGCHMPVVTSIARGADLDKDGESWNARAEEVWHEMIAGAGLNSESLFQLLCIGHDCKKNDGDVGFIKTSRIEQRTIREGTKYEAVLNVSRPCLQMVEAHRVETPFNQFDRDGKSVIDGVEFRPVKLPIPGTSQERTTLKRVGYWVKDTINAMAFVENYTLIPCDGMEFVYSQNRVGDIRGISDYYAVETTLHLLRDILKLEMRAQEVQSDLTVFITNGAGQILDEKMQGTLGALGVKVSKNVDGTACVTAKDVEKVKSIYNKIWGGRTLVGRTGDTIEMMAPNRPSDATQNLWQYLIDSYCVGSRVPRSLLFPKTLAGKSQGTELRAELDAANAGFISEFNLCWKPLIVSIWVYFIGWAIKNDPRLIDAPADWKNIEVSPPRSVLVDAGYDSAATISELDQGITNTHVIAQKLGTTEDRLIAAAVQSLKKLKIQCARANQDPDAVKYKISVTPEEIRQSLAGLKQPSQDDKEEVVNA